jgi:hypothetical protein
MRGARCQIRWRGCPITERSLLAAPESIDEAEKGRARSGLGQAEAAEDESGSVRIRRAAPLLVCSQRLQVIPCSARLVIR